VSGLFAERGERLMALASAIRVGPAQYPRLDRRRNECVLVVDWRDATGNLGSTTVTTGALVS
jgi:hypothetical protein